MVDEVGKKHQVARCQQFNRYSCEWQRDLIYHVYLPCKFFQSL